MIERLRALARSGGPTLALIKKTDLDDLLCLLDQCISTGGGDLFGAALSRNLELRNKLAATIGHNKILAHAVQQRDREARNHGEERRRYMGNNRALLARVDQLEATVAEMGEVIDDLNQEVTGVRTAYRAELGRALLAESKLTIIRRAAK